jgi:hypothetical protein
MITNPSAQKNKPYFGSYPGSDPFLISTPSQGQHTGSSSQFMPNNPLGTRPSSAQANNWPRGSGAAISRSFSTPPDPYGIARQLKKPSLEEFLSKINVPKELVLSYSEIEEKLQKLDCNEPYSFIRLTNHFFHKLERTTVLSVRQRANLFRNFFLLENENYLYFLDEIQRNLTITELFNSKLLSAYVQMPAKFRSSFVKEAKSVSTHAKDIHDIFYMHCTLYNHYYEEKNLKLKKGLELIKPYLPKIFHENFNKEKGIYFLSEYAEKDLKKLLFILKQTKSFAPRIFREHPVQLIQWLFSSVEKEILEYLPQILNSLEQIPLHHFEMIIGFSYAINYLEKIPEYARNQVISAAEILSFPSMNFYKTANFLTQFTDLQKKGKDIIKIAKHVAVFCVDEAKLNYIPALIDWVKNAIDNQNIENLPCIQTQPKIIKDIKSGILAFDVYEKKIDFFTQRNQLIKIFENLIQEFLNLGRISPPWDSMPLSIMAPFKNEILKGMGNTFDQSVLNNPNPDVHRIRSYFQLLNDRHLEKFLLLNPNFSYKNIQDFLVNHPLIKISKHNPKGPEAAFLAYETHCLKKEFIDPAMRRAKELNVPLVVVANLTYGGTALASFPDDTLKEMERMGVKFIYTKQPSSSYPSDNPNYFEPGIFTSNDIRYIFDKKPLMLVIDASASSNRFPMAFKGFQHVATEVNLVREVKPYARWAQKGLDGNPLYPNELNDSDRHVMRKEAQRYQNHWGINEIYDFHYANLSSHRYLEPDFFNEVPQAFSWKNVRTPGMICVQTAMNHDDIVQRADAGDAMAQETLEITKGHKHMPAAFNDDSHAQHIDLFNENNVLKLRSRLDLAAQRKYRLLSFTSE